MGRMRFLSEVAKESRNLLPPCPGGVVNRNRRAVGPPEAE